MHPLNIFILDSTDATSNCTHNTYFRLRCAFIERPNVDNAPAYINFAMAQEEKRKAVIRSRDCWMSCIKYSLNSCENLGRIVYRKYLLSFCHLFFTIYEYCSVKSIFFFEKIISWNCQILVRSKFEGLTLIFKICKVYFVIVVDLCIMICDNTRDEKKQRSMPKRKFWFS